MENKNRLTAVLEIGSTGIRLLVAEILPTGQWKVLDRTGKPVSLGRDVLTTGQVSRESFLECMSVLRNLKEFLHGWGINDEDVYVMATSALRAARNRDVFVDRVRLETGYTLTIVEGIEESRLMYLAVLFALKSDLPLFWRANSMILEIGGGSTEIMLLRRGQMVAAHSLKLGTIRIGQASRLGTPLSQERYVYENIRHTTEILSADLDLSHVRTFVIAGGDARIAASQIGTNLNEHCRIITREDFIDFVKKVQEYTPEDCVELLQMSLIEAELFIPGLLVYKFFLEQTGAAHVAVLKVSIREGKLIDLAQGENSSKEEEFFSQILASAVNLGRRYHIDEHHCRHIADFSMAIFDAMTQEHGLGRRERMMLKVAALVHEIGMFIRTSNHNLHGQYIITNSEIFGLQRTELDVIGNVIRYHRGSVPSQADIDYIALQREERILVSKLAAILRVADSLDPGHSQHIKRISVEKKSETLVLRAEVNRDLLMVLNALEEKAGLFEDVFGYKVVIS